MKYILVLMLVLMTSVVCAQGQKILELKNGSKYLGTVVRQDSNKLVFMGRDYNQYVFDTADVSSIKNGRRTGMSSIQMKSGSFNELSIQLNNIYYGSFYTDGVVLNYSGGRYFNYRHSVSADLRVFINFGFLPTIGATYKYQFLKKPTSPFTYASIGNYYEPGWSQSVGFRYGAGLGYQFGVRAAKRFIVKADYTRATTKYYTYNSRIEPFTDVMLNFGLGWMF